METNFIFHSMIILPFLAAVIVYLVGRISLIKGSFHGISISRALTIFFILVEIGLFYLVVDAALRSSGVLDRKSVV